MYSLRLFGGLSLEGADGPVTGRAAQHRRLAMLALLAAQRTAMVSREKVVGYLWPDTHPERARHLLADSVYVLRKALGEDAVLSSNDDVGLNPDIVETDVRAFDEAIERQDPVAATSLYVGPFLDGFYLKSAPEFEHWVDDQRRRFADQYAKVLEDLAEDASRRGDLSQSAELWKKIAAHDTYDSRLALSYINALRAVGDVAGAVRHAQHHEILLREELGVAPSPDLLDAIRQLQRAPTELQAVSTESRPAVPVAPDRIATDDDTISGSVKPAVRRHRVSIWAAAVILIAAATWFTGGFGERAPRADSDIPRLVVLPMENLGGAEDDYFADGMTDEITSRLAGVSGLRVIARQTAIQYAGSPLSAREIAEELDVDYVLEGTVRTDRAPDGSGQVRITPQLIRASDETHLWAEPYTADLVAGDVFRIQTEIAARVADGMGVVLRRPERELIASGGTDSQEAYDYYLRGKSYYDRNLRREEDYRLAADMFERAVAADPDYVEAYAMLARTYSDLGTGLEFSQADAIPKALRAAERAVQLAPDHPAAHWAMGVYHARISGRLELAEQHAQLAMQARPHDVSVQLLLSGVQRALGKRDEATAILEEALELDPRSAGILQVLADYRLGAGRYAEADALWDRFMELLPDSPLPYFWKTVNYLFWDGSTERAQKVVEAAAGRADLVILLLISWDFDDELVLRIFADHFDDAIQRRTINDPADSVAYYFAKGDAAGRNLNAMEAAAYYDSARVVLERRHESSQYRRRTTRNLGLAYARLGRAEDARRMVAETERRGEMQAESYMLIGDYDHAVDILEQLQGVSRLVSVPMLRIDPLWDPLRDHPRFQALLARDEN